MQTIIQGRPPESQTWFEIPEGFVQDYRRLGYQVRELVAREDADREQVVSFNLGIECAAQLVEPKRPELAKMIRARKKGAKVPA